MVRLKYVADVHFAELSFDSADRLSDLVSTQRWVSFGGRLSTSRSKWIC